MNTKNVNDVSELLKSLPIVGVVTSLLAATVAVFAIVAFVVFRGGDDLPAALLLQDQPAATQLPIAPSQREIALSPGSTRQLVTPGASAVMEPAGSPVKIVIPSGAVASPTIFTFSPISVSAVPAPPPGFMVISSAFDLSTYSSSGVEIRNLVLQKPITVSFDLTDQELSLARERPDAIVVQHYKESTRSWRRLPSQLDLESGTIVAQVDSFSIFALMVLEELAPPQAPVARADLGEPTPVPAATPESTPSPVPTSTPEPEDDDETAESAPTATAVRSIVTHTPTPAPRGITTAPTVTPATPTPENTPTPTRTPRRRSGGGGSSGGDSSVGTSQPPPPLGVDITSPSALDLFNDEAVAVEGTFSGSGVSVAVNGVAASQSGNSFTVQLVLREGNNTLTAVATDNSGAVETDSIQVTLDTQAPVVAIDSPVEGFVSTSNKVNVIGLINDIVVGTVNGDQATVTVNGKAADVANRSFLAADVPLKLGLNTIDVVGTDKAGNTGRASVTVQYQPIVGEPQLLLVSGNNQTGEVGSDIPLPLPLVVQLVDADDNGIAGQDVIFKVTDNNGTISDSPQDVRSIIKTTGSDGMAEVSWKLGSRFGAGNNVVEAKAVGIAGVALFTASSIAALPDKINVDAGDNQVGNVGQPLPNPLIAVVTDDGHNRLHGVPVTFSVINGGGSFDGSTTVTVDTDSDGRALVILTLGPDEGLDNNVVEATFPGNSGLSATILASGLIPGDPLNTSVSGVVMDNSDQPLAGVTLKLKDTSLEVFSDGQGQFEILGAPVGHVVLVADGNTIGDGQVWPHLEFDMVTISGRNNTLGMPIYMLPLDVAGGLFVDETTGGTLTLDDFPGFSLTIEPGSATFPDGTKSGVVSVTVVHADKIPMTPGFGQQPKFVITIQPSGVLFDPPAPITLPNVDGLDRGEITEMYSFDHDLGQFVSIGTGTVSEDGTLIASDPGVGIIKGGWHCVGNPARTGRAASLKVEISTNLPKFENGPSDGLTNAAYAGEGFSVDAKGSPPLDAFYSWAIVAEAPGENAPVDLSTSAVAQLDLSDSCDHQEDCSAFYDGLQPGRVVIEVTLTCRTTGHSVTDKIEITVVDIVNVVWKANGSEITDPNIHPRVGQAGVRYFSEDNVQGSDSHKDRISLEITISPKVDGIPVYYQIFDPDDPSAPVDPSVMSDALDDDTSAIGGDNRDQDNGALLDPSDFFDFGGGNTFNGVTTLDKSVVDVRVSHQPGDNHRVAVTLFGRSRLNDLTDDNVPADDSQLPDLQGKLSPLLTVWRTLHIEVDSMKTEIRLFEDPDIVQMIVETGGIANGTPAAGTGLCFAFYATPCATITFTEELDDATADSYEGGWLEFAGGKSLHIISNTGDGVTPGQVVVLVDPAMGFPAQRTLVVVRDDDLRTPQLPITTALTPWITLQFEYSYIFVEELPASQNPEVLVDFDPQMSLAEQGFEALLTTAFVDLFDAGYAAALDNSSDSAYWVNQVVFAYQGGSDADFDPDRFPNDPQTGLNVLCHDDPGVQATHSIPPCRSSVVLQDWEESNVFGRTPAIPVHQAAIFVESIRDGSLIENTNIIKKFDAEAKIATLQTKLLALQVDQAKRIADGDNTTFVDGEIIKTEQKINDFQAILALPDDRIASLYEATIAHEIGHGPDPQDGTLHHDIEKGLMITGAADWEAGFTPATLKRFRSDDQW